MTALATKCELRLHSPPEGRRYWFRQGTGKICPIGRQPTLQIVSLSVDELQWTNQSAKALWKDPTMTDEAPDAVMLATTKNDFGLVPAATAQSEAQSLADEEGEVVYLRHPETDKVLGKIRPSATRVIGRLGRNNGRSAAERLTACRRSGT